MAFKTNNASSGGTYINFDKQFINADNTATNGYDATTTPSNETKITASDGGSYSSFGCSVDIGSGRICVGSYGDADNGGYSGAAYIFDLDGTQLAKIKPSDGASADFFGISAAVGSGRIVVGAWGDDDNGSSSGSAYIFDLDGTQLAKITASDGAANDRFGISVAVGSSRICVGAPRDADNGGASGSAYIFDLTGNQLAKIKPSDGATADFFGNSVAVGSGRICVGAYRDDDDGESSGSAYIFDLDGTQLAKITASDGAAQDRFGFSVAVGSGRIVVGANYDADNGGYSGAAYIFDLDGTQLAKIKPSDGASYDQFGNSVAVGSGRICVGSYQDQDNGPNSGSAYIFDLDGTQLAKITASDGATQDRFGYSVAVGSGRICVGSYADDSYQGSAYIHETPKTQHTLDIFD